MVVTLKFVIFITLLNFSSILKNGEKKKEQFTLYIYINKKNPYSPSFGEPFSSMGLKPWAGGPTLTSSICLVIKIVKNTCNYLNEH